MIAGLAGVAAIVGLLRLAQESASPAIAALVLLIAVLATAAVSTWRAAVVTSLGATLAFNFFFLPPLHTFTIADPQNWVVLFVFLLVATIASHLSATARQRAREAEARRQEVTRLFDLSRDILLTDESEGALASLARHVARRFQLSSVALCLPGDAGWRIFQGAGRAVAVTPAQLDPTLARLRGTLEFDARERAYAGHATLAADDGAVLTLVPLRLGSRPVGLLATDDPSLEAGTLDALAGVVAIAIERAHFLADRKAAEALAQRADLASALLASFSHDLRTPLTAVRVAIANLRSRDIPEHERLRQADIASQEIVRLDRLFQDILDMTRIDAAAITAERQWVAPSDIVDASIAQLGPVLSQRTLRIDADAAAEVLVDPRLTSSAFAHVLENAAAYSPAETPIDIRAWTDDDGLHLSVRDHGPGLDAEELHHLFERFHRGRAGRTHAGGTGMGLAISRGLLAAEAGRIWGRTPATAAPASPSRCRHPSAPSPGRCPDMPARILLVDDEPAILAAMGPMLRSRGYDVSTAMSGRAALEGIERTDPDLIVLDLGLPDIDGIEVCRLVRDGRSTPIIVLSARGGERDKVAALDAGADDYVTKPFGAEELLARIRVALRRTEAAPGPGPEIVRGDLLIDRDRHRVTRDGLELRLTPKEFELLVFLAQHAGRVLTHRAILKAIWGPHAVDQPEHLRVLVGSLRRKLERDPSRPRYIVTEPWVGYRFDADAE